jgi:hypothetical protein
MRPVKVKDGVEVAAEAINQVEATRQYNVHWLQGQGHRIPEDWRFPRCGVVDVFRQWWIGDTVRHIIPLQSLNKYDLEFLDTLLISED